MSNTFLDAKSGSTNNNGAQSSEQSNSNSNCASPMPPLSNFADSNVSEPSGELQSKPRDSTLTAAFTRLRHDSAVILPFSLKN